MIDAVTVSPLRQRMIEDMTIRRFGEGAREEGGLVLLVVLVRDHRCYAAGARRGPVGLAGIALVADHGAGRDHRPEVEQHGEVGRVALLPAGQVETDDGTRNV